MTLVSLGFLHFSFVDVLDILVVAVIIYFVFKWLKGSSAMNIFIAIVLLLAARFISVALNMKMLSSLLGMVIDVGAIALVVIFQPEIRSFLSRVGRSAGSKAGRSSLIDRMLRRKADHLGSRAIAEISEACRQMSDEKTGALIVLLRQDALRAIVETGDTIDADVKERLIENIFFKNSPLHDGAMIIGRGRIVAARCTLPITDRTDIPAHYGMRHKAAIGISEVSDAAVIVVSEQTGHISYVSGGEITTLGGHAELKKILEDTQEQQ